jgi:16S rRNA (uracil1498-N3)-methyltransferase
VTTIVVTPIEFDLTEVEIHGDAYHHLFRVKRLRAGESVRVVDGEGRARGGVVARVDRAHGVVAFGAALPALEPALAVELLVAPPRAERAAWLVEKATELGVTAIRWIATERAVRDESAWSHAQLARLRRVAIAAVEQCGRAVVPEVTGGRALRESFEQLDLAPRPLVVLDGAGARGAVPAAPGGEPPGLKIVVGPEGGWTDDELALFERAGAPRWSLGERVLRVETAAVVAAGIALAGSAGAAFRVDTPRGRD